MQVGYVYRITLGKYSCNYAAINDTPLGVKLKRIRPSKSKIDAVRLPEYILIEQYGQPLTQTK